MHEQPRTNGTPQSAKWTTVIEDAKWEAMVLQHLLEASPQQLTEDELGRELIGPDGEYGTTDNIERAVIELLRYGLVHKSGKFLLPTRSAIRYSELLEV